jgi:hypothetical protein
MKMDNANVIQQKTEQLDICFLGGIPFDVKVEDAIGHPAALLDTAVGQKIDNMAKTLET